MIFFNVCPFDCATVAQSGKVGPLHLRLTTWVGLLLSLQPKIPIQSILNTESFDALQTLQINRSQP